MIERFDGEGGRRTLIETLREQKIVSGNTALAEHIASMASLIGVTAGTAIIEQSATDNDVYFIVAGSFDMVVNGRKVARRFANEPRRRNGSRAAHATAFRLGDSERRIRCVQDYGATAKRIGTALSGHLATYS